MFECGRGVGTFYLGKRVRTAVVGHKERVALGEIARIVGVFRYFDKSPVRVFRTAGRYAFGDDGAAGVFSQMYHLGAGVGLLEIVGHGQRIEFAYGIVAFEDTRRVFPCDCGPCFDLRP